ncbi:MAG: hypothetical protein AMXMBFR84_35360 [Candidatus Hydrogenedentota bacterium]
MTDNAEPNLLSESSLAREGKIIRLMDFFDRAYIINLPERVDRRREMDAELKKVGMLGQSAKLQYFPAVRPDDAGGFPSRSVRGCFMSHLSALKKAYTEGLSNLLIMEDDLSFEPAFVATETAIVEMLSQHDWGFAYFGHGLAIPPGTKPMEPYHGPIVLAHFYAVNGPCLGNLVAFLEQLLTRSPGDPEGGPMHVDGAFSTFRERNPDIVTLVANPSMGGQRSSRSDIHPSWFDRIPILRSMAGLARSRLRR